MRRCAIILLFGICGALLLSTGLAGCGGSSSTTNTNVPSAISLAPITASIDQGGVVQLAATVTNSAGTVLLNQTITYTSSNTAVASVSSGGNIPGLVCGGTWDNTTTPVVCTPGAVGPVTITAAVGSLSATTTVYVHQHITSVTLTPTSVNCDSQTQGTFISGHAFSGATDITSTVGPLTWASNDSNVVSVVSNTSDPGLHSGFATAVNPGQTSVFATVSGVNSVPTTWVTCPVVSISAHVSGSAATSFTIAVGAAQALAADVTDSKGAAVTVPLTWISSAPGVATTNGASATGIAAGTAGITASCSPPSCNNNLGPAYSNVVSATVTGTSASQTIYATSSQLVAACSTASSNNCTSVIPIPTSNNAAGTAITLPSNQVPNSIVFDAAGTNAYLGSSGGVMILNGSNNSITGTVGNALGKILAVSPDGKQVIVSDPGVNVTVFNSSSNTVQTLNITNATAADFTPDSFKAYIVGGSTLYAFSPGLALRTVALAGAANDVNFLSNGEFGYVAGPGASVPVFASCDNSLQDTVVPPGTPTFVRKVPATTQMAAVDSPNLEIITAAPTTPPPPACPPTLTDSLTTVNTGVAFTPNALIITPDGTRALITSNLAEVTIVNLTTNAVTHVPMVGGAHCFTGGVTLNSSTLYVGCSDGAVHAVNVAAGADFATPIIINFPNQATGIPVDLVAVRP